MAAAACTAAPTKIPVKKLESMDLVTSRWTPYTAEKGEPRIALDIVDEALTRTGPPPRYEVMEVFTDAEARLKSEEIDGSPALWHTPERDAYLLFSEPYLENRLVLVGLKGAPVEVKGLGELAGQSVAIVEGYAYGELATGPTYKTFPTDEAALQAVIDGSATLCLVDDLVATHLYQDLHDATAEKLAIGEHAMVTRGLHLALRDDYPDADAIIARFNETTRTLQADGSYHRALGLQWLVVDLDGDGKVEAVLTGTHAGTHAPEHPYRVRQEGESLGTEDVRFFVDGEYYDNFEDIPEQYRVEPEPQEFTGGGWANLLTIKF